MSDDDRLRRSGRMLGARLDEERPLNTLLPELGAPSRATRMGTSEGLEQRAVHPRVLEVELEDGHEWALAVWKDPGGPEVLSALEKVMRGTLLAHLSQPAAQRELVERRYLAMECVVFDEVFPETRFGLKSLGFEETTFRDDQYAERMGALREEARAVGFSMQGRPKAVWRAEFARPGEAMDARLEQVHKALRERLSGTVWGEEPGRPSRALAELCRQHFNTTITPGLEGLDSLELFFAQEPGAQVRWMRPLFWQALCDFVGVLCQAHYGYQVQWAVCEPEPSGFVPPPLLRLRRGPEGRQLAVGARMVDWAMAAKAGAGSIRAGLDAWVAG